MITKREAYVEMYSEPVFYYEYDDKEKLNKQLMKDFDVTIEFLQSCYTKNGLNGFYMNGPDGSVICVKRRTDKIFQDSVLVHECVHAANKISSSRGVEPDFDNDESYAYLVKLIFRKCKGQLNTDSKTIYT